MPNHIENVVTFIGSEVKIQELKNHIKGVDEGEITDFDFNKIIERPIDVEDTYHWNLDNWDTKWNAYNVIDLGDSITFQTAWSAPFGIYIALSNLFPTVEINVEYADEDFGYNVGKLKFIGGSLIEEYIPQGGSKEAIELAMKITDEFEYRYTDLVEDISDVNFNEYEETMVEIFYENKYVPYETDEFNSVKVLNKFKDLALSDENYELVIIIDKLIAELIIKEQNYGLPFRK